MECREHREWGECEKWKMPPNIPGNVLKNSEECRQTFGRMSLNILGNVCVTQGNWDAGLIQDFILLSLYFL